MAFPTSTYSSVKSFCLHRALLMKSLCHHFQLIRPILLGFLLDQKLTQLFKYFYSDFLFFFSFLVSLYSFQILLFSFCSSVYVLPVADVYLWAHCESQHNCYSEGSLLVFLFETMYLRQHFKSCTFWGSASISAGTKFMHINFRNMQSEHFL